MQMTNENKEKAFQKQNTGIPVRDLECTIGQQALINAKRSTKSLVKLTR